MTRLVPPKAPALQQFPKEYAGNILDRFAMVLRIYFVKIDSLFNQLLGDMGGAKLNTPYGAFSNSASQTAAAANTPYVVTLNTSDHTNGTSLASNQITVTQDGIYNIQFSLQFENTNTGSPNETWVWIRKNGSNVAGTGSTWSVHASHGGTHGYTLGVANFFVSCAANDYIELVWATNSTTIQIEAYASSTSPFTRPSIPSSVVTVSFVSALTE